MALNGSNGNLPPNVAPGDPHFYDAEDCCPDCGCPAGELPYCEACGAVLDPDYEEDES